MNPSDSKTTNETIRAAKNETIKRESNYISKVFSSTGNMISNFGNKAKIIPGYNHIFAYDIQDAFAKFIIADGKLKAYEMNSPYDLSGKDESTGASVAGGWTEGPMVIKRNGVYYLTYCGNHVWGYDSLCDLRQGVS
jgi:hypothetical protein